MTDAQLLCYADLDANGKLNGPAEIGKAAEHADCDLLQAWYSTYSPADPEGVTIRAAVGTQMDLANCPGGS